jgi:bidirectional [NiFe] hydrogenase diaphorase subunit
MQSSTVTTAKADKPKAGAAKGGDKRFKVLDMTMKRNQYRQDALIEVLHKAQESFGFLEEDVLIYVARNLKLHLFSLKPNGAHTCVVCLGTACYVKGGGDVLTALEARTGIKAGETTADGQISIMTARCIGACGIAPAVVFDGKVAAQQTPEMACDRMAAWEQGE